MGAAIVIFCTFCYGTVLYTRGGPIIELEGLRLKSNDSGLFKTSQIPDEPGTGQYGVYISPTHSNETLSETCCVLRSNCLTLLHHNSDTADQIVSTVRLLGNIVARRRNLR